MRAEEWPEEVEGDVEPGVVPLAPPGLNEVVGVPDPRGELDEPGSLCMAASHAAPPATAAKAPPARSDRREMRRGVCPGGCPEGIMPEWAESGCGPHTIGDAPLAVAIICVLY